MAQTAQETTPAMADSDDTVESLSRLLSFFASTDPLSERTHPQLIEISKRTKALAAQDYRIALVHNDEGQLCSSYPSEIIYFTEELSPELPTDCRQTNSQESEPTVEQLSEMMEASRFSRVRARFVVPVIRVGNRHICRSGTLSKEGEVMLNLAGEKLKTIASAVSQRWQRSISQQPSTTTAATTSTLTVQDDTHILSPSTAADPSSTSTTVDSTCETAGFAFESVTLDARQIQSEPPTPSEPNLTSASPPLTKPQQEEQNAPSHARAQSQSEDQSVSQSQKESNALPSQSLVSQFRCADIRLLTALRISAIFDLMVENKKVKYGLTVSSSEKCDRHHRYSHLFSLCAVPYPGVEFFYGFKTTNRNNAMNMLFEWNQSFVNSSLLIPPSLCSSNSCALFSAHYQSWDILTLTSNYLLLFLNQLRSTNNNNNSSSINNNNSTPNSASLLIHCISGWDRTPLFVSLLRLSLWADGLVHRSLSAPQILFFTLAYDWLLFGHLFKDRQSRDEDILFFAFDFLPLLSSPEFSLPLLNLHQSLVSSVKRSTTTSSSSSCASPTDSSDASAPESQQSDSPVPTPASEPITIIARKTTQTQESIARSDLSGVSPSWHVIDAGEESDLEESEETQSMDETPVQQPTTDSFEDEECERLKESRAEKLLHVHQLFCDAYEKGVTSLPRNRSLFDWIKKPFM